jgi:hypothetical protein
VTKAAALELLDRNSRQAAAAVRAFTDEELDRAAPFSLSFGAPVTAQFAIEDHALRHSWHREAFLSNAVVNGKVARRRVQKRRPFCTCLTLVRLPPEVGLRGCWPDRYREVG